MVNKNAIKAVFERSLKLSSKDSCLIVADTIKETIGRAFYEYARGITSSSEIVVIQPTAEHASEPPKDVAKKMLEYNVQILVTQKSLTHTRARREATRKGARIATMPSITEETANRCLDVDYKELRERSNCLYDILKKTAEVRVYTELGTDIKFKVGGSGFFGKDGGVFDYPGAYGNLPEGEVAFAPCECEGVYVVDASFPGLGLLSAPITFTVNSGMVSRIEGDRSDLVRRRLDKVGPLAYLVAELGIGLNPKARIVGNILEDEKVIGTAHIAVGNNLSFGGKNDVPLHLDGVITKPDIFADGLKIMEKGMFLVFS